MVLKLFERYILSAVLIAAVPAPYHACAEECFLPLPGQRVNLSAAGQPLLIKGLRFEPAKPLHFDFIVDSGSSALDSTGADFQQESRKLIKYFLTALTVPEKNLWVNLSPYEKDRLAANDLGQTQMGQDMLAQDYLLKQLTASMVYPKEGLGKEFWEKIYAQTPQGKNVSIDMFNKVWIIADRADVVEGKNSVFIAAAHLKVMMEKDYLAAQEHFYKASSPNVSMGDPGSSLDFRLKHSEMTNHIIRQTILPAIEREVNEGAHFAPLRQMYYSMILASWYKMRLKDAIITLSYANRSKVTAGVNAAQPADKEAIYQRYLMAYKKGVVNMIQEEKDPLSGRTFPRKYFSGGLAIDAAMAIRRVSRLPESLMSANRQMSIVSGNMAMVSGQEEKAAKEKLKILVVGKPLFTLSRNKAQRQKSQLLKDKYNDLLERLWQQYDVQTMDPENSELEGAIYAAKVVVHFTTEKFFQKSNIFAMSKKAGGLYLRRGVNTSNDWIINEIAAITNEDFLRKGIGSGTIPSAVNANKGKNPGNERGDMHLKTIVMMPQSRPMPVQAVTQAVAPGLVSGDMPSPDAANKLPEIPPKEHVLLVAPEYTSESLFDRVAHLPNVEVLLLNPASMGNEKKILDKQKELRNSKKKGAQVPTFRIWNMMNPDQSRYINWRDFESACGITNENPLRFLPDAGVAKDVIKKADGPVVILGVGVSKKDMMPLKKLGVILLLKAPNETFESFGGKVRSALSSLNDTASSGSGTMESDKDKAMVHGGIDLNADKMRLNISQKNGGMRERFNQAMAARLNVGDFDGLTFHIDGIRAVTDLRQVLGI